MRVKFKSTPVQVSCTVANCLGCEWAHYASGRIRYYIGPVRVPKAIWRWWVQWSSS